MHTYIHSYIHAYILARTYTPTYMHACIHTCVHAYIHKYIHTYMKIYLYTDKYRALRRTPARVQRRKRAVNERIIILPDRPIEIDGACMHRVLMACRAPPRASELGRRMPVRCSS